MVELRKRKTPPPQAAGPSKKAKAAPKPSKKSEAKDSKPAPKASAAKASEGIVVGSKVSLDGFGGTVQTNDSADTTLKALVEASKGGVVLFTYPKASTPGCTTQACLFRDSYAPLTATGFAIYGLSTDSPKANTTFKEKQNLPYPLLCDPKAGLIGAIGFKKSPSGTQRGVFVVGKDGTVLAASPGGPAATVDVVKALVEGKS